MLFFISPAKAMQRTDALGVEPGRPRFLDEAHTLALALRDLGREGAQACWKCSDALAEKAWEFTEPLPEDMLEPGRWSCAAMSYVGIQYQHLAPEVMTEGELGWLQERLRIVSGLYGALRPFDGVVPYRLEMGSRLAAGGAKNLYGFWGAKIAESLAAEEEGRLLVNLASQEYAKAVVPHAPAGTKVLACTFGVVRDDGRFVSAAPEVKIARGTFLRWCAERRAAAPAELVAFDERGYAFSPERSSEDQYVFVRN